MSLRDYFDRLRVRAVLRRNLGKGEGEFNACARAREAAYEIGPGPDVMQRLDAEIRRRDAIRRAVIALCADAAAPKRRIP